MRVSGGYLLTAGLRNPMLMCCRPPPQKKASAMYNMCTVYSAQCLTSQLEGALLSNGISAGPLESFEGP